MAQGGSGNYKTVQEAFNAVPANSRKKTAIHVYKQWGLQEKVLLRLSKERFVTIIGEVINSKQFLLTTIILASFHHQAIAINTRTSWRAFKILANDFIAKNITFQNDAGFTAGQAVAVEADGDKATFINCRLVGNQDVLFTNNDKSRAVL